MNVSRLCVTILVDSATGNLTLIKVYMLENIQTLSLAVQGVLNIFWKSILTTNEPVASVMSSVIHVLLCVLVLPVLLFGKIFINSCDVTLP